MVSYRIIKTTHPIEKCYTYGISVERNDNGARKILRRVPDISTNESLVEDLARRCTKGKLELCHLMDVIEDTIS